MPKALSAFLVAVAVATLAASDPPYVGRWKLNPAKSDFKGTTISFAQAGPGEMQFSAVGQSYTFKMDGKDYPALFGNTASWKQFDANTWETTQKLKGQVLSVDTTTLSADGKSLTIVSKGTKPNGEAFQETTAFERASGGPGLPGTWRTSQVTISSPSVLEIAPFETDGITLKLADYKASCSAKFDGKDYPVTGPTVPAGWTLTIKKAGPQSFEMTQKMNGKTIFVTSFSASADGKTLTEEGTASATNEKIKAVYERQ